MSEELLIRHGSPTLAGLKTGSLFTCPYDTEVDIREKIRKLNRSLVPKGLRVLPLRYHKNRALIYVYRPKCLARDFEKTGVKCLLGRLGYACHGVEECLVQLTGKLRSTAEFPHEIGLFLGYPLEDVCGFMENKAWCCKCVGCWKVYGDEEQAKKLFDKYQKCTSCYCELWEKGVSLEQLTVAG